MDVNTTWSGPGGIVPVTDGCVTVSGTVDSKPSYLSTLTISPLATVDGGSYTCEVAVAPRDATFITISQPASNTGSVNVTGRFIFLVTLFSLPSTHSLLQ